MTLRLPPSNRMAETNAPLMLLINLADALSSGKVAVSQAETSRLVRLMTFVGGEL